MYSRYNLNPNRNLKILKKLQRELTPEHITKLTGEPFLVAPATGNQKTAVVGIGTFKTPGLLSKQ